MLGFQMALPMLTESGSRTGLLQPAPARSTRHRLETMPGIGSPSLGRTVSGATGRLDSKIRYEPSGDMAGAESGHSPEKGASVGCDHSQLTLCDSRIAPQ